MVTFGRVAVDELVNSPLLTIGIHLLKAYYKALMSLKSTGGLRTADVGIEPGGLLRWVVSRIPPLATRGKKVYLYMIRACYVERGLVPGRPEMVPDRTERTEERMKKRLCLFLTILALALLS